MLAYLFAVSAVVLGFIYFRNRNNNSKTNVPTVAYSLPFFGHALWFKKDMLGFLKHCYETYGSVFKIKIFSVTMTVVCDKDLAKEFFKQNESQMSLFEVLRRLYFADAFSDDTSIFETNINLIKQSIAMDETFVPKIYEEAQKLIGSIQSGSNVKLSKEAIRFVTRTSARCFIDVDLSDELFDDVMSFTEQLNQIVVVTYIFPKWIIKKIFGAKLRKIRMKITNALIATIESYRTVFGSSRLIVNCIKHGLTNTQIADIIITLLYVSSENTALGLSAAITDIYRHRNYLQKLRLDVAKHIDDVSPLLKLESLDNAVMESARLNIHVFSLNRHPVNTEYLGDYYVGDVDSVVLCGQMMHDAIDSTYDPDRHTTKSKNANNIMTWGSGLHLCPGKNFALYEIKIALAMWIMNFDSQIDKLPSLNYFSPSAFAERDLWIDIHRRKIEYVKINEDSYIIKNWIDEPAKANILRELTLNSMLTDEIDMSKAHPVAYYNNPYTNTSTCDQIPRELADLCKMIDPSVEWNSMYCNKYYETSTMATHKDKYVGKGISISFGASCDFWFENKIIKLEDKDILVSDFSKYEHGVLHVNGPIRYSIQMRHYVPNKTPITDKAFYAML